MVKQRKLADAFTLECGSYDVNGSVRDFFTGPYTALDIREGPGVEMLGDMEALPFADGTFECCVTVETMEHVKRPWVATKELARVTKQGGTVLITGRGYDERGAFGLHGYPDDYNRFTLNGARIWIEDSGLKILELMPDPSFPGYFCSAVKRW
jgi:SAM-dependent methyltransferase